MCAGTFSGVEALQATEWMRGEGKEGASPAFTIRATSEAKQVPVLLSQPELEPRQGLLSRHQLLHLTRVPECVGEGGSGDDYDVCCAS